jgi:hypothetical protein
MSGVAITARSVDDLDVTVTAAATSSRARSGTLRSAFTVRM